MGGWLAARDTVSSIAGPREIMQKKLPPFDPIDSGRVQLGRAAWIWPADLQFTASRGGGPGGQAVNKLSTRITLRVSIDAIRGMDQPARDRLRTLLGSRLTADDEALISSQTSRSQLDNKRLCVQRLRELVIRAEVRPKSRKKRRVTKAMKAKRLDAKRQHAERKSRRRPPSME